MLASDADGKYFKWLKENKIKKRRFEMKRINIYNESDYGQGSFAGWFNKEAAEVIAEYETKGGPYISGYVLLATAKGRLVINEWTNCGKDFYKFAKNEAEIAEILAAGGYAGDNNKLKETLAKYEI